MNQAHAAPNADSLDERRLHRRFHVLVRQEPVDRAEETSRCFESGTMFEACVAKLKGEPDMKKCFTSILTIVLFAVAAKGLSLCTRSSEK